MLLIEFAFALTLILVGAELFTNSIEWLGKKMNLSEGAVGSVLAAVGTAMPEATIPIIALLYGTSDSAVEIGTGAILGAPLMLSTIAMFISGVAVYIFAKKRGNARLNINLNIIKRDICFFVSVYTIAVIAGIINIQTVKNMIAGFLILTYILYVFKTVRSGSSLSETKIAPLIFARKQKYPHTSIIAIQIIMAITLIITGGHLFVDAIEKGALLLGISYFVLATLIIPIATELPEKFNSVIWIRQGKDTLALGNITGAMVFQSSIIPAIGILLSPWKLQGIAMITCILTLIAGIALLVNIMTKKELFPHLLIFNGIIYLVFIIIILNI